MLKWTILRYLNTMIKSLDKIKDTCSEHRGLINKDLRLNENEEKERNISFSFVVFKTSSVKCEKFNNYFETRKSAIASSYRLMKAFEDLSQRKLRELEMDKGLKQKYHYHSIEGSEEIGKIDKILKNEYGFNSRLINQQENSYYQFEYAPNGNRIIITKVGSVFIPLFLDNNHLIYYDSSINQEYKMKHKVPSVLSEEYLKKCDENDDFQFCKMLIEEYEDGTIATKEELLKQWHELYD